MRLLHPALGLVLLCAHNTAQAGSRWYDPVEDLRPGSTVDIGFSSGGDDLNRPDLTAGHPIQGTYYAGDGLSADVGMVEFLGDTGLGFKQELGVWLQAPDSSAWFHQPGHSSEPLSFDHPFGNVLAFYHWDVMALGAGFTYQTHLIIEDGRAGNATLADFENAHGLILMYQYRGLSLRYTHIDYHVKHDPSVPAVDGSNFALYLTFHFF